MLNGLQKTNKIAIALIAVLVITMIIPTASAFRYEDTFDKFCNMQLNNAKITWRDAICELDLYKMFRDIRSLVNKVSDLDIKISDTQKTINSVIISTQDNQDEIQSNSAMSFNIDQRLQILEGKIHAPYVDLSIHVHPEKISKDEPFVISGAADRMEQGWIDFTFFNPNGTSIQNEWVNIQPNNIFFSDILFPNYKWTMIGNYTIQVTHGIHSENATIQYLG